MKIKVVFMAALGPDHGTIRQALSDDIEIDLSSTPPMTIAELKALLWASLYRDKDNVVLRKTYPNVASLGDIQEYLFDQSRLIHRYSDSTSIKDAMAQNFASADISCQKMARAMSGRFFEPVDRFFHIENIPSFWEAALKVHQEQEKLEEKKKDQVDHEIQTAPEPKQPKLTRGK